MIIEPSFQADRTFTSLAEAADFILHEYALELPPRVWKEQTPSGLLISQLTPKYLFRGECGRFPTTVAGCYRADTYSLRDGRRLAPPDRESLHHLITALARRFTDNDYGLDAHSAIGLLQHYALPTWIIDFTCHAGYALSFAAAGGSHTGRLCVLPMTHVTERLAIIDLMEHSWSERPRRQDAFGITMPKPWRDLKKRDVRRALGLKWYEFPISQEDKQFLRAKHEDLVRLDNDPAAGFLRHHITEYVEAYGKLSPVVTDWLLERVPVTPRCAEIMRFDGDDVILHHRPFSLLGIVDTQLEESWSRRYWSNEYADSSWDRMKDWSWPPVGTIYADPRTFHNQPPPALSLS